MKIVDECKIVQNQIDDLIKYKNRNPNYTIEDFKIHVESCLDTLRNNTKMNFIKVDFDYAFSVINIVYKPIASPKHICIDFVAKN